MNNYNNLKDLAALSVTFERGLKSIPCNFTITHEGIECQAYEASIAPRDLLVMTDKGVFSYVVDTYGDRVTCELFDWELE